MSLTTEQKDLADKLFIERDDHIINRDHNRSEIEKLKFKIKQTKDWLTKYELRRSVVYGNEKIKEQSRLIRGLSISKIAKRIESDRNAVAYYERSSYIPRL